MPKPITIESILRMNVPALRRNTALIVPMFLTMTVVCIVLAAVDEARRPMWWAAAAVEAFLGPVIVIARLRYLAIVETVQKYIVERDRAEAATR